MRYTTERLLRWLLCSCLCVLAGPFTVSAGAQDSFLQRLPDDRPSLDINGLRGFGLQVMSSRHLVLVTDLPEDQVQELPALADQLYEQLCRELGPPAPAADGSEFQLTGFLMAAEERFAAAGLLPPEKYVIRHGRHLGYRFWMRDQTSDYYRRHLLLHEFVHCFMMCETGMSDIPPLWFTEGVAEFYATHRQEPFRAGVVPDSEAGFEGWGRIRELREQLRVADADVLLRDVLQPADSRFVSELKYAQGWALFWMMQRHPELQQSFRPFLKVRSRRQFERAAAGLAADTIARLHPTWLLVLDSLTDGFDEMRSFPQLHPEWEDWSAVAPAQDVFVRADQNWQASGLTFERPTRIRISAQGRCILSRAGGDWESEPQGITIDFIAGQPLGQLMAMAVPTQPGGVPERISVGPAATLLIPGGCELWLRINDLESSRADNADGYQVRISAE